MAELEGRHAISVIIHNHKHDVINVYWAAHFPPKGCYGITVKSPKLEFDAHFPTRLVQLNVAHDQLNNHDTLVLLEQLFGENFVSSL